VNMLRMTQALSERMNTFVKEGYPLETCGLLLGVRRDGEHVIAQVHPARNLNVERAADRYELDPQDYLAADREAREAGRRAWTSSASGTRIQTIQRCHRQRTERPPNRGGPI
jgi:proteasome lid subunit RPN8/RPN11